MKTIRLLYPDWLSGGLQTYYFGANLLQHILPANPNQPLVKVDIAAPDGLPRTVQDGICGKDEVLSGIRAAQKVIAEHHPEKIITIGGNCLVSQAPFDYLHGLYPDAGIIWIDAHPDVSMAKDGYPNAHAMVLGALLGKGEKAMVEMLNNPAFKANELLYVGLQGLNDYQTEFLDKLGVDYKIQTEHFIDDEEIETFAKKFDHILVHLDIDVLNPQSFHSTYFANPELVGDGSGGGKMGIDQLGRILQKIACSTNIVGLTVAEYLPFDEERLSKMFASIDLFNEE